MRKEKGIGSQSYATAWDSGSKDLPLPERDCNAAQEMIYTVHTNEKSVFTLNNSGTFWRARWYYPKSQNYREVVCPSFMYVFVNNEIPQSVFASSGAGSVGVAGRALPCYKRYCY